MSFSLHFSYILWGDFSLAPTAIQVLLKQNTKMTLIQMFNQNMCSDFQFVGFNG